MGKKVELEVQMLNEARAEVAIADQKAGVVLASAGIGFAAVLGGLLAGDWRPSDYGTAGQVVWWVATVFAFGVVISGAVAIWPRFTTRSEDALVTYWGHVARYATLDAFTAALEESPVDRERTKHQLWRLAKIVRKKYWCIRLALLSGAVAAMLFVTAGIIG